jgi:hypothetical protein
MRAKVWSVVAAGLASTMMMAGSLSAQTAPAAPATATQPPAPEPAPSKPYTITTGIDFTSAYLFRGIRQHSGGTIVQPYFDLGVTVAEGVSFNVGNWDSIHSSAPEPFGSWYESDYYASVTFTAGKVKPGLLYTSYTSPADNFNTVHELAGVFTVDDSASAFPLSPKAVLAFELSDGSADGGENKGVYLELGVKPNIKLAPMLSVYIPTRFGFSLKDYYELDGEDNKFGYFTTGFQFSVPAVSGKSGSLELHGGMDFQVLGDHLKIINEDKRVKPIGTIGFTYTY